MSVAMSLRPRTDELAARGLHCSAEEAKRRLEFLIGVKITAIEAGGEQPGEDSFIGLVTEQGTIRFEATNLGFCIYDRNGRSQ